MSIIPQFNRSNDLLLKLCRDSIRVYGSKNTCELQDRFYDFCITAHSLRDWVITEYNFNEELDKNRNKNKDDIHNYCKTHLTLKLCRDITNSSKHFKLYDSNSSTISSIENVDLKYIPLGSKEVKNPHALILKSSIIIIDVNDVKINLLDFMNQTIEAWINVFDNYTIFRNQKLSYTKSLEIKCGKFTLNYI